MTDLFDLDAAVNAVRLQPAGRSRTELVRKLLHGPVYVGVQVREDVVGRRTKGNPTLVSSPDGKFLLHRRALFVTALERQNLWP
jgi:hypothetical protein